MQNSLKNTTPAAVEGEGNGDWPLGNGTLPSSLFSDEHLRTILFDYLPILNQCAATTIRQGLKVHLKRTVPEGLRYSSVNQILRDRVMASTFGNSPAARDRASEIVFIAEQSYSQHGRSKTRGRNLPSVRSFPDLLWSGYVKAPEMAELHRWMMSVGVETPEYGEGVFLTATSLSDALTQKDCPVERDDPWLARSIVLFSSLLPENERRALLQAGCELGCTPIANALGGLLLSSTETTAPDDSPNEVMQAPRRSRPKLVIAAPAEPQTWTASDTIICQVEDLRAADLSRQTLRRDAEEALLTDAGAVIDGPPETWASIADAVDLAREAAIRFAGIRLSCEELFSSHKNGLAHKLSIAEIAHDEASGLSVDELATMLLNVDAIRAAIDTIKPDPAFLDNWRLSLIADANISALWDLTRLAEQDNIKRNAETTYREEAAIYCAEASTSEITAFLGGLDGTAIEVLLPDASQSPWVVADAILLRARLDKTGAVSPSRIFQILSAPLEIRRALLRFVNPTSSMFDAQITVRRLIAVERLRDALEFGALAEISDPAAGLSDPTLVGRTVHELIELVVSNLDILASGSDLVRMLRVEPQGTEATERLANFIHAPATLSGNFRRLREMARVLLLSPLLNRGRLDASRARLLSSGIASGESLEEVIAAFESERPDDRLEARHREQLSRYLHNAKPLLDDFLNEANNQPDGRHREFTDALRQVYDKLRPSGELGTVEWFEAEVVSMLNATQVVSDHKTLVGDATPISARRWDEADREWAMGFIDLPEFHDTLTPTPLEIAASVLHWKGLGTPPTTRKIVEFLIDRKAFREALHVAQDAGDNSVCSLVRDAAKPAIETLEARAIKTLDEIDPSKPYPGLNRAAFDAALSKLDVESAEEILELWQLDLAEHEEKEATKLLNPADGARRSEILRYLHAAGLDTFDERMSVAELEASWADVLAMDVNKRAHLAAVQAGLEKCHGIQPELSARMVEFNQASLNPDHWLSAEHSADFADLVREAVPTIANWIVASTNFRDEQQTALIALTAWYLDFVIERSKSLHEQDDDETLQSGLDRLLEVASIVQQAQGPLDCLTQLSEIGEMDISPPSPVGAIRDPDRESFDNIPIALDQMDMAGSSAAGVVSPLPEAFLDALSMQDWQTAIDNCRSAAVEANAALADRLRAIARAIEPLLDQAPLPVSEMADMFPSSAAWLSNAEDGASQISDSRKTELGFQLLAGAVAADSGQKMHRTPGVGGSWAELLARTSPFRRMLSAEMPSRTGRVLEALLSGHLGLAIAERLWDAATSLSEPQLYRTPLLHVLNDNGAHEVIIKLAQRHEASIAPRLSQLFELRTVAQNRPDLLPVAQSVAEHLAGDAKGAPFRAFIKGLPSAAQMVKPMLRVSVDGSVQLRPSADGTCNVELPIVVTPEGLVPAKLFARLFTEDDVTFEGNSRMKELSSNPIYFASDFAVGLRFGRSWFGSETKHRDSVRIRIEAKTVTDELITEDAVCPVQSIDRARGGGRRLDTDTLLDLYPGVANNPVVDESFFGRIDELERLHQVLISAKNPSPVLLTGMRRVGKTSLLYAFHKRCSLTSNIGAISIYQSLAERRVEFSSADQTVSATFFRAISHGLVRPSLPVADRNYALCARIRRHFDDDWKAARRAIQECYDEESLSSSMMLLAERLREWTGLNSRFIFLIDEAEALVAPYQAGGRKKLELEQFLQSLREVSQTTGAIGLLLSGSNHINMFAREYKNAFFGSSQAIELEGFGDVDTASQIVAPKGVEGFIQFDAAAVDYTWSLCAGMPQFLWQIGATTAFQVRMGTATRNDIRAAVAMLVGPEQAKLPFKPYEILEPIDNMLSLENAREKDLLWMLLYRVAEASSLAAQDAAIPFVIDQSLLAADDRTGWRRRLRTLVDLKVLRMESASSVRFQVPLFAEGFRAPKNWQEFNIRQQQVAI